MKGGGGGWIINQATTQIWELQGDTHLGNTFETKKWSENLWLGGKKTNLRKWLAMETQGSRDTPNVEVCLDHISLLEEYSQELDMSATFILMDKKVASTLE